MPPPSVPPKYLYKILSSDPQPIGDGLPVSDLDRKDGFIHLSTAEQVPKTVARFFADTAEIFLLEIPYRTVEAKTRWEDAGPGCFPHIYDDDLPTAINKDNVERVIRIVRQGIEDWETAAQRALVIR